MFDLKGKNVLVTGATGLLGRPLVEKLLRRGANVVGVGYENMPKDWNQSAEYFSHDLSGDKFGVEDMLDDVQDAFAPADIHAVFHLAGAKGGVGIGRAKAADFMHANLYSTMALLKELVERTDSPPRVLFTSSVGAYPGDRDYFVEDWIEAGPPHPSDYFGGYAKRFGEILCKAYREQHGLDYVVVRPTNCFGPYDRFDPETGMVIAALIARLESGERPLRVWGDGKARRDFLYSKDCAEGMVRAMEHGKSGEAYNLGTGVGVSVSQILRLLLIIYGDFDIEHDYTKPSGPAERRMDMVKSFRALGHFLRYDDFSMQPGCGLEKALRETVEWHRANKDYEKYDPFKE